MLWIPRYSIVSQLIKIELNSVIHFSTHFCISFFGRREATERVFQLEMSGGHYDTASMIQQPYADSFTRAKKYRNVIPLTSSPTPPRRSGRARAGPPSSCHRVL